CRAAGPSLTAQRQHFGLDAAAVARRLNVRWRLPGWLAALTGHLVLPAEIAANLGARTELFRVVQLAAALVDELDGGLDLAGGLAAGPLCRALDLEAGRVGLWLRDA